MRSFVERRTTEPDRRRVTAAGPMAHPPNRGMDGVFATLGPWCGQQYSSALVTYFASRSHRRGVARNLSPLRSPSYGSPVPPARATVAWHRAMITPLANGATYGPCAHPALSRARARSPSPGRPGTQVEATRASALVRPLPRASDRSSAPAKNDARSRRPSVRHPGRCRGEAAAAGRIIEQMFACGGCNIGGWATTMPRGWWNSARPSTRWRTQSNAESRARR
jgi:hypothetical protein